MHCQTKRCSLCPGLFGRSCGHAGVGCGVHLLTSGQPNGLPRLAWRARDWRSHREERICIARCFTPALLFVLTSSGGQESLLIQFNSLHSPPPPRHTHTWLSEDKSWVVYHSPRVQSLEEFNCECNLKNQSQPHSSEECVSGRKELCLRLVLARPTPFPVRQGGGRWPGD